MSRAQSWERVLAVVQHLTRLSLTEGVLQVRGWLPPQGGGPLLEADLDIAGGAASGVRVALGVSCWKGGRRPCGGVPDLRSG